jgi:hypothetical protein
VLKLGQLELWRKEAVGGLEVGFAASPRVCWVARLRDEVSLDFNRSISMPSLASIEGTDR